ncbi:MAG: hypothetical protein WC703_01200 [Candidatus Neomarinimicrobiota bacterium]
MKYETLISRYSSRPYFESGELDVLLGEPPAQIRARLSRWVSQKKLIQLHRGHYLLPELYRKSKPNHFSIANSIYHPSYISLHSALEFYGLIPESVSVIQSVTTQVSKKWTTEIGQFAYYKILQERFWGYRRRETDFFIALPEKALLDFFYLSTGEWTISRLKEMRFQNLKSLDIDKLKQFTEKINSPKTIRTITLLLSIPELWT